MENNYWRKQLPQINVGGDLENAATVDQAPGTRRRFHSSNHQQQGDSVTVSGAINSRSDIHHRGRRSQALIFVTRSRGWSYIERPGVFLMIAFVITQLIATIVSAFLSWELAGIKAIGWSWMGIIWVYSIITYLFLDPIKFAVRYALSGRAWNLVVAKHGITRNC
ncbi:hypothetical protein Ahy_B06g084282 isoform B [Arachis hypogaea]|uniref:Uncharacterized protein n=1 Tax=Arachis hypogaea TaxID=3818 RepID=A0A444YRH7_ARAHY|nr:hypothetical protein Ahy_B06g084282 isoform B [Arachis hypogaea]